MVLLGSLICPHINTISSHLALFFPPSPTPPSDALRLTLCLFLLLAAVQYRHFFNFLFPFLFV